MKDDQCQDECTCTGGPYIHGPNGRKQILLEIEQEKQNHDEQEEDK